jgi:long-chain acyl-CoA synthetase
VAAVVVVEDGSGFSTEALRRDLATRLAAYKLPTTVVLRAEPLPRTATGKVLKRQLREELDAGAAC